MATRRKNPQIPEAGSTSVGDAPQEGLLARWSRRKTTVGGSERLPPTVVPPAAAVAPPPTASEQKVAATVPPIDKLDENSDYSGFLSADVSEELRRVALRKLFHLPQYNFVDGLDDYAGDFTNFVPLGDVITADMRHHMERHARELEQQLLADGADRDATPKAAAGADADTAAAGTNAADGASVSTDQAGVAGLDEPDAPPSGKPS